MKIGALVNNVRLDATAFVAGVRAMLWAIKRCRVCKKPHGELEFTKLDQPGKDGRTHEAACPNTPDVEGKPPVRIPLWHVSCAEEKSGDSQGPDQDGGA